MTTITKQFSSLEDVYHFIDDEFDYVMPNEKAKVEIVYLNFKYRVTIETEVE